MALIDLASVCPGPKSEAEFQDGLDLAAELVRSVVRERKVDGAVHEVACRLYSGWFAHDGTPLQQRAWLLRNIKRMGGLKDGVRLIPEPADSLACAPRATLIGTYKHGGQKMVDQMLAHDLGTYARTNEHECVLIVSDDDDFVPAVIAVGVETSVKVCLMRQRVSGGNDHHFQLARVELLTHPAWI